MSSPQPHSSIRHGPRWYPAVTVVPYVVLAVLVVFTVIEKRSTGGSLTIDLALCALAAAWMLWMFTLHPGWRDRPRVMGVFMAGLIVIMAILVLRDSWFGFFVIGGYAYAYSLLPWPWRLYSVAAVAVVSGTSQMHGLPDATPFSVVAYVVVLAANVLAMCAAGWIGWNNNEQNRQRVLALEEVNETNRRLEATLAENAALHTRLLQQAREAGVRDERHRMAREIHDTLAQGLTGIITQLQAAEQAKDDSAEWQRHFTAASTLARESLSEARRSVHALRPEPLEVGRLREALADVAARWSALHGVPVEVTTTGTARPMSPEAEFALLRTAQATPHLVTDS
jgi:signal transduction histidine kinase